MKRSWRLVLAGGVVAGTLDIVYACVFWAIKRGVAPQRVLQRVASGLLGEASLTGGWATAALGLVSHYFIAISMAVTYYLVARRWSVLWERPVPYGAAYGLLLYGIMNHVVVPRSAAGPSSKDALWIAMSIVVHMFLIGVPCAMFARLAVLADLRTSALEGNPPRRLDV
ncbi:MAG: hypothetical protein ACREMI_08880 [Gemmatimonadales bacterium]